MQQLLATINCEPLCITLLRPKVESCLISRELSRGQLFSVFEHIHESLSLVVGIKLMPSIKLHILSKTHPPMSSYLACEHKRYVWNLWLEREKVGLTQIPPPPPPPPPPWANVSYSDMTQSLHVSRSLISSATLTFRIVFCFQPLPCVSEHNISEMQKVSQVRLKYSV